MDLTSELTVVIPVRIDSRERKENLDAVLYSLLNTTDAFIIIMEADTEQRYYYKDKKHKLLHVFIVDNDPIFHRTRYLNKLLNLSKTNIVGIWDTDVILATGQIKQAVKAVKNGITLCYPYDGCFLFLNSTQSENVKNDVLSFLQDKAFEEKEASSIGRPSVGGAFVVNKQSYLRGGGENENFYGWSAEDTERLKRMEILGESTQRIEGPLFHLHHPRGVNSTFGDEERSINNLSELIKICSMNTIRLKEYIETWTWIK